MPIQAQYLGMPLSLDDLDVENLAYFKHCAEHDFHLQACADCNLLRYPPTTACPWCMSREVRVGAGRGQGRGALLHARCTTPSSRPSRRTRPIWSCWSTSTRRRASRPSTRRCAWSATWPRRTASWRRPRWCKRVGIGTRVRMVFTDVAPGLALPQWTIDETAHATRQALALPAGVIGGRAQGLRHHREHFPALRSPVAEVYQVTSARSLSDNHTSSETDHSGDGKGGIGIEGWRNEIEFVR